MSHAVIGGRNFEAGRKTIAKALSWESAWKCLRSNRNPRMLKRVVWGRVKLQEMTSET